MTPTEPTSTKKLATLGKHLYEKQLREKLETRYRGKIVAIDPETGDYFIGNTLHEATEKGRKKHPHTVFYSVKVGYPAVYSFISPVSLGTAGI